MDESIFRGYDVRGVYPDEVNVELAERVARTLSEDFFEDGRVVVGRDAREGSEEMYEKVIETIESFGKEAVEIGLVTTPMMIFMVNYLDTAGGIMITASHNPKEYNGIKMVRRDGMPIVGRELYEKLPKG